MFEKESTMKGEILIEKTVSSHPSQRLDWQLFALLQAAIWESTKSGFSIIEPILNTEMEIFFNAYRLNNPFNVILSADKKMLPSESLSPKNDLAHQLANKLALTCYLELDLSLVDVKAILKEFFPTQESLTILNEAFIEEVKNVSIDNNKYTLKTILHDKDIINNAKQALLTEYVLLQEKNKILNQLVLQQKERRHNLILVILAAIFLTPFSLIFTLPRWFESKRNEKMQKIEISNEKKVEVKEKRRLLRGHDVKEDNSLTPKKIVIKNECYMDKAQINRFNLFANNSLKSLQANKEKINEMVRLSKQESIRIRKSF